MRSLRILTWHVHGNYLYYLSHCGHEFYLPVLPGRPEGHGGRGGSFPWGDNVIDVPAEVVKTMNFDCILFQSRSNYCEDQYTLLSRSQQRLPRIYVEHDPPREHPTDTRHPVDDPGVLLVHVTAFNDLMWDSGRTPTRVIEHGVVIPEGVRYKGNIARGLVVINNLGTRGRRLGADVFERVRSQVPLDLVGMGSQAIGGLGEVPPPQLAAFAAPLSVLLQPDPLHQSRAGRMRGNDDRHADHRAGHDRDGDGRRKRRVRISRYLGRSVDRADARIARRPGRGPGTGPIGSMSCRETIWDQPIRTRLGRGFRAGYRKDDNHTEYSGFRESGLMRRRVALISEHASPLAVLGGVDSGGQNVYVGQLASHLALLGYDVDVFTRRDGGHLPRVVRWTDGVRIIHVPAGPPVPVRKEDMLGFMDEFTAFVLRACRRKPYDLIHANFFMSGLVAADVKAALGTPFVVTFHALGRVRRLFQAGADGFPEQRLAIEDRIIAEADRIIAECPQDEEDLIRLYDADPEKITIVPCGFDPCEFWPVEKEAARKALGLDPRERVLLQLGRMVPRKGVETAILGLGQLRSQHGIAARLLVVGGESDEPDPRITPEIGRLQTIASTLGLDGAVQFVGRRGRDQLKYYYSAADIFVTTPWYEPFGITPVEAMACGTPVVGSNVGGIKFTVRDGENGYLVPPKDPGSLAERIAHLYQNPKLLSVLSRQAVRRANDLFTWQRVTGAVADLYEEVLSARQPERCDEVCDVAAIDVSFDGLIDTLQESRRRLRPALLEAADLLSSCLARDGKILVCGLGSDAFSAQHFVTELISRYRVLGRTGLPALALSRRLRHDRTLVRRSRQR